MSGEERKTTEMDRNTKPAGRDSTVPTKVGNGSDNASSPHHNFNKKSRRREGGGGGPQSGPRTRGGDQQPPNRRTAYNQFKPRTKGYYNDNHREEVTQDLGTEGSSVLKMGSKKTNLNHLLNFSVSHRDDLPYGTRYSSSSGGSYRSGRGKKWTRKAVRYNKEQFLQANCQFVVKEKGDYTLNAADPDTLVDWDLIEQVKIFGNEVPSCPICLFPPVVAKITRCGHIYCWGCILHYLSLSEKQTWRKCPICYEAVHQKDLKSVVALKNHSFQAGDEVTMKLMRREKGSTYAIPVQQWKQRNSRPHNLYDSVDLCFSKLLVASPDQVQDIVDCEKTALEVQLADEGESLEGSYVKAALELLKERQVNVSFAKAAKETVSNKVAVLRQQKAKGAESHTGSSFAPLEKEQVEYSSAFSDEEAISEPTVPPPSLHITQSAPELKSMSNVTIESNDDSLSSSPRSSAELSSSKEISQSETVESSINLEDVVFSLPPPATVVMSTADGQKVEVNVEEVAEELTIPSEGNGRKARDSAGNGGGEHKSKSDSFYFYQSIDGQHIYLHSMNARCLVREYGSLENSPAEITAKIVELDGITMNEELRSRLRYLNHLPLTCEFKVVELALKPPVLSKETLAEFQDEVSKRKRQRQYKQRVETKQLAKMQQDEIKKYEGLPEMRLFQDVSAKFVQSEMPSLLAHSPLSGAGSISPPEIVTPVGSPSNPETAVVGSLGSDDGAQSSLSFAQMLRAGKIKKSQPAMDWPTAGEGRPPGARQNSDSENEDRVPVPRYSESFGDAISAALQTFTSTKSDKTDMSATPGAPTEVGENTAGKGKKKKKQKKLLFVNTMARGK